MIVSVMRMIIYDNGDNAKILRISLEGEVNWSSEDPFLGNDITAFSQRSQHVPSTWCFSSAEPPRKIAWPSGWPSKFLCWQCPSQPFPSFISSRRLSRNFHRAIPCSSGIPINEPLNCFFLLGFIQISSWVKSNQLMCRGQWDAPSNSSWWFNPMEF